MLTRHTRRRRLWTETKNQSKSAVVFFVWTHRLAERFAETKLQTEQSLNRKLINSPVDFAQVNQLEIKF